VYLYEPLLPLWRTIPPLLWYKVGINAREKRRIPRILWTLGSLVISQSVAVEIQIVQLFAFVEPYLFLKRKYADSSWSSQWVFCSSPIIDKFQISDQMFLQFPRMNLKMLSIWTELETACNSIFGKFNPKLLLLIFVIITMNLVDRQTLIFFSFLFFYQHTKSA